MRQKASGITMTAREETQASFRRRARWSIKQCMIRQEITTYRYDNCNRLQKLRREYKNTETSTAQPQIIRYTYDRKGNMLSEGEKKYSYDSFGRMVRAEVPVEHRGASNKPDEHAGFNHAAQSAGEPFGIQENSSAKREFQVQINRYDGEDLRHEMEENGRLIKFLYNEDSEVVAEETTGNGTITRYIRGLGIISSDSEEAKTYYHYVSDEQGSITHVLSEDAEILNHYSYDAFGNIIEKTEKVENRFCYNGEMLDPVTQQYYLRARFYNPVIGRFTQEDTYYGDGLNLYQYCQANPVGYVDPSGHNICPTQLSLYKKYKEFFTKKMPEAEAKKKAYEYMRKKMGLTADDPFTEASEGGTKSAYNDRGNTVKNWKGQNAAGAYQSATEKGNSKSGNYSSLRELMLPEEAARYDEHWLDAAEKISKEALDNQIDYIKNGGITRQNGKIYEPSKVCCAVDLNTGKTYIGYSGKRGMNPSKPVNGQLESKLQIRVDRTKEIAKNTIGNPYAERSSFYTYPVDNCAEVFATNNALLGGADIDNIFLNTRNFWSEEYAPLCDNCKITFENFKLPKNK